MLITGFWPRVHAISDIFCWVFSSFLALVRTASPGRHARLADLLGLPLVFRDHHLVTSKSRDLEAMDGNGLPVTSRLWLENGLEHDANQPV